LRQKSLSSIAGVYNLPSFLSAATRRKPNSIESLRKPFLPGGEAGEHLPTPHAEATYGAGRLY
jgi:hypothetical protein